MKTVHEEKRLNVIELHPLQFSDKSYQYLIKCRDYEHTKKELPCDVYEEGRDNIIVLRMMRDATFTETDEEFTDMPESLQELLRFMRDNNIDIIYCDIECGGIGENPREMTPAEFEESFINSPHLPIYILGEDEKPEEKISYIELYEEIFGNIPGENNDKTKPTPWLLLNSKGRMRQLWAFLESMPRTSFTGMVHKNKKTISLDFLPKYLPRFMDTCLLGIEDEDKAAKALQENVHIAIAAGRIRLVNILEIFNLDTDKNNPFTYDDFMSLKPNDKFFTE